MYIVGIYLRSISLFILAHIHLCILVEHHDVIQYYVMMLSFTTRIHVCHHTQDGWSALMKAASCGHTAVVQELVKSGATLDIQNVVCC